MTLKVAGPFQTEGSKKLPKFKIDFAFEGAGQSIEAGLDLDGREGLRQLPELGYAVSDQVFKQFKAGYEQAQQKGNTKNQSLASLKFSTRASGSPTPRTRVTPRSATTT